jgi:RNA-directed DNA polymerase
MSLGEARHQKPGKPGRTGAGRGEAASEAGSDEAALARHAQTDWGASDLLGQALTRENMAAAWKHVKANKGSAGVDGCTVQDTGEYLKSAWPDIRRRLLDGSYRPDPVRRVGIPKPGGGVRELGIPTVVDRLIQQALLQVLQPLIDPSFSAHSHGFRPRRSAHGAVLEAQQWPPPLRVTTPDASTPCSPSKAPRFGSDSERVRMTTMGSDPSATFMRSNISPQS